MEGIILQAVAIVLIGGLCYFLLNSLPLDIGPMKVWGLWIIIAICAVLMVIRVVLPLVAIIV